MGQTTAIEWCDSTLNLEMGCDGCELWTPKTGEKTCYSGNLTQVYAGNKGWPDSFDKPKLFPERLKEVEKWKDLTGADRPGKPWLNGLPRLIFLDDMGDTFTESLPIDWLAEHLPRLAALPHTIILLTKRANRMLEFSKTHPFPKNFWLLVSVTSAANYNRIEQLLQVRGGGAFGVSYEPAWGRIDLTEWLRDAKLRWVIAGGSSGLTAKPAHPDWFRDVRDQCQRANCAYFFKQWGEFGPWSDHHKPYNSPGRVFVSGNGTVKRQGENNGGQDLRDFAIMERVGKKAAGATLDGREWREFPG
jgi:protein gp37